MIEAIGVDRAKGQVTQADLVLWLGEEAQGPAGGWDIEAQVDRPDHTSKIAPRHRLSAVTGEGMAALRKDLVEAARVTLPKPGEAALGQRQHAVLSSACEALSSAAVERDPLVIAEQLRLARRAFDSLVGRSTTEHMLDALFGRFCIGK
jgi:tRNA modification GTPase